MNKKPMIYSLLVLPALIQSVAGRSLRGHQSTIDLNEEDICANVYSDPGGGREPGYKLIEVMTEDNKTKLCCSCNPGFKLIKACNSGLFNTTSCVECENGSYISDYAHTNTECIPSTQIACQQYEVFIPSTKTSDSSCECMDGYYKKIEGKCQKHSKCPPGKGVYRIGDSTLDTECEICGPGKVSPLDSSTQRCRFSIEVLHHKRNRHLEATTKTLLKPSNKSAVDFEITTTNTSINPKNNSNPNDGVIIHQAPTSFFENIYFFFSTGIGVGLLLSLCGSKMWKRLKKHCSQSKEIQNSDAEKQPFLSTISMNDLAANKNKEKSWMEQEGQNIKTEREENELMDDCRLKPEKETEERSLLYPRKEEAIKKRLNVEEKDTLNFPSINKPNLQNNRSNTKNERSPNEESISESFKCKKEEPPTDSRDDYLPSAATDSRTQLKSESTFENLLTIISLIISREESKKFYRLLCREPLLTTNQIINDLERTNENSSELFLQICGKLQSFHGRKFDKVMLYRYFNSEKHGNQEIVQNIEAFMKYKTKQR